MLGRREPSPANTEPSPANTGQLHVRAFGGISCHPIVHTFSFYFVIFYPIDFYGTLPQCFLIAPPEKFTILFCFVIVDEISS